jgi:hypothetical protein
MRMKQKISEIFYVIVALMTILASVPIGQVFAAGNTFLFSPSSQQMNINDTFTVSAKAYVESAGDPGTVSGTIAYPTNLLRVTATSTSGSSYGNPALSQGSGTLTFSGTSSPGPSGLTQIFTITFQAIGAGTATLSYSADSAINGAPAVRNTGTYTIINPNPTPTPTPTPTPAPKPTPTPTPAPVVTTPAPAPVQTPPTQSDVTDNTTVDETGVITDITPSASYDRATVTWKHSREQADTHLIYGGSRTTMTTKAEVTKQADGSFSAALVGLKPGVRYYFTITSTDAAKKESTYDGLVITRGYPVVIAVTENNSVAAGATIQIGSLSRTTDKDGKATVELADGNYSVTITAQDKTTTTVTLVVASKTVPADGSAPASQTYTYNLVAATSSSGGGTSILTFVIVLVVGGALLVLGVLGYLAYRRRQYEGSYGGDTYTAVGPSVVVDDGYNWQQQTPAGPLAPPPTTPEPPTTVHLPGAAADDYEEPKDMFELAKEREVQQRDQQP